MKIQGTIRPCGPGTRFTRENWCQLLSSRPEFRHSGPRENVDPLTGEKLLIPPPQDAAEVIVDGQPIGQVFWSNNNQKGVIHLQLRPAGLPLVKEWAEEMDGTFHWDSSGG